MTKEQYLQTLKNLLQNIDEKERNEAIQYVEEYFQEASHQSMEDIIKELGTPEEFANSIKQNIRNVKNEPPTFHPQPKKRKHNYQKIFIIFLCVFIVLSIFLSLFIAGFGYLTNDTTTVSTSETTSENMEQSFDSVNTLYIDVNRDITIQHGETNKIECIGFNENDVNIKKSGDQIQIIESTNMNKKDQKIIVTVTDYVNQITIVSERGNVDLENISGNNIEIENDLGNVFANQIAFNAISVETEQGNVDATILGNFEDYAYDISNEQGNTHLPNKKAAGAFEEEGNSTAAKKLDIETELGNINIQFKN